MLAHRHSSRLALAAIGLLAALAAVAAGPALASINPMAVRGPVAGEFAVQAATAVPAFMALPTDRAAARLEDLDRAAADLPPRFAIPQEVAITPATDGLWEDLDGRFRMWRLRIRSAGAMSLNLGFTAYRMPKGGRLSIYPTDVVGFDDPRGVRIFTDRDNEDHGQLWTPVVVAEDIVVELVVPVESLGDYDLALTSINRGYRFFGESLEQIQADKSGACNVDVVCPEGDLWRREINSVGVISTGGGTFCSGAMLNNTSQDETPYFLTADHCGITSGNAASLVVYWNFQSPVCGAHSGGSLSQFQTGAVFLATGSTSDFTLVRMDDPVNPAHKVSFAGWDRSTANPQSATAIHHPNTDEKSISFEYQPVTVTSYYGTSSPGDGTHLRVGDWDVGTTEPGSSGSPLFNQNHHVVGQLHGGDASCFNNSPDWYGRFYHSWPSVAAWLDPTASGAITVDTLAPWVNGLQVTGVDFESGGSAGGPFAPSSAVFSLNNNSTYPINYTVGADVAWVGVANASGVIAGGGQVAVAVSLNAAANALPNGLYTGTLSFNNLTDGLGNTTRGLKLQIPVPVLTLSFPLNANPGWALGAGWAFGVPAGGGGEYGNPDPTSGYTGANVLGYNLAGDYPNLMAESHLTTTPIDCSAMQGTILKFWRHLNVEEPAYDHAYVRVSTNNGSTWTQVWTNTAEITDTAWTQVSYDISALVDGAGAVLIRWTMGTTDVSFRYSGWNVDDVELWALPAVASGVSDLPGRRLHLGNHPNPFNPLTRVEFVLEMAGFTTLDVYDMQGHLVRRLVAGELAGGPHSLIWDGLNDSGRKVGSGVYLAKLTAGNRTAEHKMVMLK